MRRCEFVSEDYFCKQCKHVAREPTIGTEIFCRACNLSTIIGDGLKRSMYLINFCVRTSTVYIHTISIVCMIYTQLMLIDGAEFHAEM